MDGPALRALEGSPSLGAQSPFTSGSVTSQQLWAAWLSARYRVFVHIQGKKGGGGQISCRAVSLDCALAESVM